MASTPRRFVIGDKVAVRAKGLVYTVVEIEGCAITVAWWSPAKRRVLEYSFRASQLVLIQPSPLRTAATRP